MEHSGQIGSRSRPVLLLVRPTNFTPIFSGLSLTSWNFKLTKCATYARDVDNRLRSGNTSGAALAFRNAEDAFESAQRCLLRVERDDWREDTEVRLSDLGSTLDGLWVKLISGGTD